MHGRLPEQNGYGSQGLRRLRPRWATAGYGQPGYGGGQHTAGGHGGPPGYGGGQHTAGGHGGPAGHGQDAYGQDSYGQEGYGQDPRHRSQQPGEGRRVDWMDD
jgi:hypothetical protein